MLLTNVVQIERRWEEAEDALGDLFDGWSRRGGAATSCRGLKTDEGVDKRLAFFAKIGDLGIGMLTESFGRVR